MHAIVMSLAQGQGLPSRPILLVREQHHAKPALPPILLVRDLQQRPQQNPEKFNVLCMEKPHLGCMQGGNISATGSGKSSGQS